MLYVQNNFLLKKLFVTHNSERVILVQSKCVHSSINPDFVLASRRS